MKAVCERSPSVLPFSTTYLGTGCKGPSLSREAQTSLTLATPICSRGSQDIISPANPGSVPEPPQLALFNVE